MDSSSDTTPRTTWSERLLLWGPGTAVGVGAGVVTAHGLFIVATAAGVPAGIAWLYPIITDGLALVAYGATHRLYGRGTLYAWTIVVLAAGLSGLAQAIYLADDAVEVSRATRFGVGAWPAVAAALSAHLIYILGRSVSPLATRPWAGSAASNRSPSADPPHVARDAGLRMRRSEAENAHADDHERRLPTASETDRRTAGNAAAARPSRARPPGAISIGPHRRRSADRTSRPP